MQGKPRYYILKITRDGMEAYITLIEEDFQNINELDISVNREELIKNILQEVREKIKVGLREDKLLGIFNDKIYDEEVLIAKGIKPVNGRDGQVKYNFPLEKNLSPKIKDDGTVDYKELDIINNVKKGDVLAYLIPPQPGENGYRVTGEEIKYKPGKPPHIKYDQNVELREEDNSLVSKIDGLVELKGNRLIVSPVLRVENVGNETGHINFNGAVVVEENALNGFNIIANGDVEIRGVIEGAYVQNKGDVFVRQGIQGYNRLTVETDGSITTKFVENAIIHSKGNITAEAIMHSNISCKGSLSLIGRRGLIVGGRCRAGRKIEARTIGSSMATSTILEVGTDPYALERKEKLNEELEKIEENLDKITQSLSLLEQLKKARRLDQEKTQMYLKLLNTRNVLLEERKEKKTECDELSEKISNLSQGVVKVSGTIYPGVRIIIGTSHYFVRDELTRCRFYREDGEIKIGPY